MSACVAATFAGRKWAGWLSVALCLVVVSGALVGARYLPTRADETDVEILKDIIRGLIAQSNLAQVQARLDNKLQGSGYYSLGEPAARLALERRALELPIHSDGDHHLSAAS